MWKNAKFLVLNLEVCIVTVMLQRFTHLKTKINLNYI